MSERAYFEQFIGELVYQPGNIEQDKKYRVHTGIPSFQNGLIVTVISKLGDGWYGVRYSNGAYGNVYYTHLRPI